IGRTLLPLTSFRITIGIFVTGSIIRPRIFISSSIAPPPSTLHHTRQALSDQRVWTGARHLHRQISPNQRLATAAPMGEVQRPILRRAPDPLSQGLIPALNQHLFDRADQLGIPPDLNGAL